MRIDSSSSLYPLDRPARSNGVSTSYREVKAVDEIQDAVRSDEGAPSANASYAASNAAQAPQAPQSDYLPAVYREAGERYQSPMSARAAQALASYGSTANMTRNLDANEVVGLDLYA
jgi:hypothetical protein